MATIKKGVLANIVFPMVDGTDFASVESGLTASDFESKVTKRYIGVTHGNSTAASTGTISKTITLVRSGIFQQTLNETETDFDYLVLSFEPSNTSLAHQLIVVHPVDYKDSDIFSQLSDIGSNLLSYLTGMSGMLSDTYSLVSDVDSALTVHDANLSDQVSNVQSAIALLATSNYLSVVHSDLYSAIGGVTATLSASDISDIASAVWSEKYNVYSLAASTFGSFVTQQIQGASNLLSNISALVSDVDSALTLHDANLSDQVSNVQSAIALLATSNYLSQVHSDLYSAIGGVTATLSASDISDIASAVWAADYSVLGAGVSSFGSLIRTTISSRVSDIQSYLVAMSGALSDVESQVDLLATSNYLSQVHSDLFSAIGNVSVTLTASDISDIASATAAAISAISQSDISNIASAVWSEKYNVYSLAASSFGSFFTQQIQGASNLLSNISGLISDVDSALTLHDANISDQISNVQSYLIVMSGALSDVESQVDLVATSNYLSQVHSDLYSAVGAITAGVSASDISDIASAVWADTIGARVDSRVLVVQSMVSDVDSQVLLNASMISDVQSAIAALNDPTAAAIADAVWDEPYSDHLTASTTGSRLQKIVSDISDVDSALTLHDANISGMISDVDSQLTVNYNLISDVESQLDLTASLVSDIESQLDVTHSLLSDVESAVDAIWTTALTESYNADGSAGTAAQLLYGIFQNLTEFAINSTTITVKKLDGSTTAMTFTLDDATSPTSRTRAT